MRIVLYGLGKEALFVLKTIRKEHTIVAFTDSFAQLDTYAGYQYVSRECLKDILYDYIILGLNSRNTSELVRRCLVEEYAVEPDFILDFFELFTEQKVDKVLTVHKEPCRGIILGNSRAALGINPQYIQGRVWRNLATPDQDIYYNYKTLEKCAKDYQYQIQDMEYLVMDLYNYAFFHIDVSLSGYIIDYWGRQSGFFEDKHNYKNNVRFTLEAQDEIHKEGLYAPLKEEERRIRKIIFDENMVYEELHECLADRDHCALGYDDYPTIEQHKTIIDSAPFLPSSLYYKFNASKYGETKEENIFCFHEIIKLAKQINSKIKVILTLMPSYKVLERYWNILLEPYKYEFEREIEKVVDEKQIFYWNFQNKNKISDNPHFFTDPNHLNYYGGIAFTDMLNQRLMNIGG